MTDDAIGHNEEVQPAATGQVVSGQTIPTVNEQSDAPTVYADAIQGVMLSPWTVKITFVEHFPLHEQESLGFRAKNVLNLSVPAPQLRSIGDLFTRLADDLDGLTSGTFENE